MQFVQDTSVPSTTQPKQSMPTSSLADASVPAGSVTTVGLTASGVTVTDVKPSGATATSMTNSGVMASGVTASGMTATKVPALPPAAQSQPKHSRLRLVRPAHVAPVNPQQARGVAQEGAALAKASEQQLRPSLQTSAPGMGSNVKDTSCRLGTVSGEASKQAAKQQSHGAGYVDVVQGMQMTLYACVQISSRTSNLSAGVEVVAFVLYVTHIMTSERLHGLL